MLQLGLPKSGQEMTVQQVTGIERAVLGDIGAIGLRRRQCPDAATVAAQAGSPQSPPPPARTPRRR
jgi:hypothetical protein